MIDFPEPVRQAIEAGYAVVPAGLDKVPKAKWRQWQTEAQTDEDRARLGHGSLWGLVTGARYGITLLDFDGPEGTLTREKLGLPIHVRTPGGTHTYVRHPGYPVKNSARKFPEFPGLDTRGDGGLAWFAGLSKKGRYDAVVWPPEPIALPPELTAIFFPQPGPETNRAPSSTWAGPGYGVEEAVRFLKRVCQDIERAPEGTSNAELNKAAYSVGGLVAAGQLNYEYAWTLLSGAADDRGAGDPDVVISSAMAAGAERPWKIDPPDDEWIPSVALKVFGTGRTPEPVPFPTEALPEPLDELVRQGAKAISCPPDYIGAAVLPVLGLAVGGYVDLEVTPTWHESAGIYVTIVGQPGSRKSPAIDLAMRPVWDAERQLEDVARAEVDEDDWKEVDPPQLVVDDSTIEALFGVLERNERGVIMSSDELTGWVGGMGQYKGGLGRDRQHWLSIWSRKPIKVNRVKARSRTIRRPFVPVLGGIQPEPLEGLLHGKDDGLLPRLLMARGEFVTPKLERGFLDQGLLDRYDRMWNRVRDEGTVERTVHFDQSGYRAFETWANEHYQTLNKVPPELAGAWSKMDGQCARLCLILAMAQGTEATAETVDRAVALVRYFQGQAAGLLQGSTSGSPWEKQQSGRLKHLAKFIQNNPGCSKAELMAMGPEWAMSARTLDPLLETLEELGVWNG